MKRMTILTVIGIAISLIAIHDATVVADQCDQLRSLISRLQARLDSETERLNSAACQGSARTICQGRIRSLRDQIATETKILRTCTGGVIPNSGMPAPPPHKPFDLHPRSEDDYDQTSSSFNPLWDYLNGIPKNPLWASQIFDQRLPNAMLNCGASGLSYHDADWQDCTSDPVWTNHDKCGGGGHVNWRPVAYEGTLWWHDHSGGDDDYNMGMASDNRSLYTTSNPDWVTLEFDSDETIDPFSEKQTWWRQLRQHVDAGASNPKNINSTHAITIGLLGLDYEHDSHTELHPVYALAINDDSSHWAFFIRNWGNEGYCSEGKNPWSVRTLSILFPNNDATDGQVASYDIWGTTATAASAFFLQGQGLVLKADLPPPEREGYLFGELTIQFSGSKAAVRTARTRIESTGAADVVEGMLSGAIRGLSSRQRRQLAASNVEVARRAPSGVAQKISLTALPATRSVPLPPASSVELTHDTEAQKAKTAAICNVLGSLRAHFTELCAVR
jgi:hypothetical protein